MKVLDVDLFQDGLQRNIAMLDRLRSEIETIHRSVEGLVQMEDQLKGEGGNAIRSFYGECHLPFLQFFQLFSEHFKQVLHHMETALFSLEPDSAGYILEQFLEGELEQGLTLIGQLTASLTDETNSIMDQVSDIVGLPHLDDSGVQEGVIYSKRKRDDTVTQLHEFDATQTTALTPIEQDMLTMETWLADLEGLFKDGLTDIHFQTNQWAALASCNPLLTDLATSTISGIDSAEVEGENDTIVDTGIEVVKGVGMGLFDAGKDFVVGLWDTITNPKATVDGLVNAVSHPVETYNTIKTAISESYERDMVNGDANTRGHWVAYAIGTVATSIVGTKGANALIKTGTTAAKVAVPKVVSATNNASTSLANLLPYTPRPHLAMPGEIPYNVVNGAELKDQLLTMAKVESGVNGAGKDLSTNVSKNLVTDKQSTPNKVKEPEVEEKIVTEGTGRILDPKVVDEILAMDKGLRPNPLTYLSKEYIDNHLAKFEGEVTKIQWGAPTRPLGPPSGTFVMPKSVADDLIARSNGDVSNLEHLLSLEPGTLGSSPVRVNIPNPTGLRIPDGNEIGANSQWIPGGYTGGGIPEATIDQVPLDKLIVTELFK
ncbi:ribonuclease YeeF family protein [Psychrobacillus vulpis]|nr:T7SS effector LXG polymorphic toxin [Psychrobacillus vulpis]